MKCLKCGKYTLENSCCNTSTVLPLPPKYSPEDKYAKYRRKYKEDHLKWVGKLLKSLKKNQKTVF